MNAMDALDAMACVSCSDPCSEHDWVDGAMLSKLNTEKVLFDTCKKKSARSFFICSGQNRTQWPAKPGKKVELNSSKIEIVTNELNQAAKNLGGLVLVYICSEESLDLHQQENEVDIIAFPEMQRYENVRVDQFQDLLSGNEEVMKSIKQTSMPQSHVMFVCTHNKRDKRCGVAGRILLDSLIEENDKRETPEKVLISEMSHVGGHGFAGNVLIYPDGHLYGRVRPCHSRTLLENHVDKGIITKEIYRGNQLNKDVELF